MNTRSALRVKDLEQKQNKINGHSYTWGEIDMPTYPFSYFRQGEIGDFAVYLSLWGIFLSNLQETTQPQSFRNVSQASWIKRNGTEEIIGQCDQEWRKAEERATAESQHGHSKKWWPNRRWNRALSSQIASKREIGHHVASEERLDPASPLRTPLIDEPFQ